MAEIRSYASLSGSLLARKGAAKPAMRSHTMTSRPMIDDLGWDDMGTDVEQPFDHVPSPITALTPAPKPGVQREEPEPVLQQRALAERFAEPEPEPEPQPQPQPQPQPEPEPTVIATVTEPAERPVVAPAPARRTAASANRKAAFTLRLDTDRHLRLRLASALTGKSSQLLVTAALDSFLDTLPDVARLAEHLPPSSDQQD